jgi:diguanylate cyclase (GGDEF)-like protein
VPKENLQKVLNVSSVFHIPTLTLCLAATLVVVSGFLTLLWWHDRGDRALARWSLGFWVGCIGLCLVSLREVAPPFVALGFGNAGSIWSLGLIWLGCLAFEDEVTTGALPLALAGGFLWLSLFLLPSFADDLALRLLFASALYAMYSFVIVRALGRGQCREPLPARFLAMAAFGLHGFAYLIRIPLQFVEPVQLTAGYGPLWYGFMTFGFVMQGLIGALAIFAMVHERSSRRYKLASELDFLTAILNRRAFLASVETARARRGGGKEGAVLALVDADQFKRINDTYGHGAGDAALVALTKALSARLPAGGLVGRLGGEEFALYLPQDPRIETYDLLEALRSRIADSRIEHDGAFFRMTVSIGAVVLSEGPVDVSWALAAADRALYQSKRAGRNRVTFATLDPARQDVPQPADIVDRVGAESRPQSPRSVV